MSIKNLLIEMKNMSELMVDLAYSAVLFNSVDAAEEVLTLENRVNAMNYEIKKESLVAARSYEDAEKFYEMFGEDNFSNIADKIGASALQAVIEDAIEENDSSSDFIKRIETYAGLSMNDLDIRESANVLYEKYVL